MSASSPTGDRAYTGDVPGGGPPDVRELPGLTISKLAVSEMANNAYLLLSTATGEALLVDAAAEPEALLAMIGDADLRTVVTTHGHWDHHRALPEVVAATGAVTVAGSADAADLPVPVPRAREHGGPRPGPADRRARGHRHRGRPDPRGAAPARPHAREHRARLARAGRRGRARVHRGQPVTGRSWENNKPQGFQLPDGRPGGADLRPVRRLDVVLPRPREGQHARRRATAPRRV